MGDQSTLLLYAAIGLNNNPALGRVLLAAGARPDDGESVYHSTEHPDLVCMRLLFEYGASLRGTNALKHMPTAKTWKARACCSKRAQIRTS
ncbi:MAG TPA: hypothetical protein VH369_18725 [Bryobacteraceae bacterium]|jgi:hypothetical protein